MLFPVVEKLIVSDQSAFDLTCDIANAFHRRGAAVCLVGSRSGPRLEKGIDFQKICRYDKSTCLRRILTWLRGAWEIFRAFRRAKDAELFIISNPPLAPLLPLFLKNRFSLLLWDIWPDVLVSTNTLSGKNPLVRLWKKLNRRVYARAEKIFTISEGLAGLLEQYVPRERITVIPLWADTDFLKPLPKSENRFLREHGLSGKFVVMYSGNIGNTHCVENLVDVAEAVKDDADIVFVIIGEGGKKELIRRRVESSGAKNVLLLPYQERAMLPFSLSAADVGVITLSESSSQISVPSKTYSLLATGTPLLCLAGKNSELAGIVRKYGVGAIFSPNDVRGASEWLRKVKSDQELHRELSERSRAASRHFTPKNAERFADVLLGDSRKNASKGQRHG